MTNEELCRLIHEGHRERLTELWEQTKRFGAMQARRFFWESWEDWNLTICCSVDGLP